MWFKVFCHATYITQMLLSVNSGVMLSLLCVSVCAGVAIAAGFWLQQLPCIASTAYVVDSSLHGPVNQYPEQAALFTGSMGTCVCMHLYCVTLCRTVVVPMDALLL